MMASAVELRLRQRVMRAGFWSVSGLAFNFALRFGSNLLMTRLLLPEMFGLVSLATTFMVGLTMFSDLGLRQFVVQSARGDQPSYLNTAWVIQIVRGLIIWILALCLSLALVVAEKWSWLPTSSVYASPALPFVLGVLSFATVIAGFTSTKLFHANRGLALGLITRNEVASQLFGLILMVVWVLVDRSVWALVAGSLGSTLARVIASHLWLPGPPNRWEWNAAAARELVQVGKWIFLASILGFLVNSGDQLLLAGYADAPTLGLYVIASLYVGSAESILGKLMNDVSFPAFSEIVRNRRVDLKRSYYGFHTLYAGIAYMGSGFLMTFGEPLVRVLYDDRYKAAGPMLVVLAPILITVPFRLVTQSLLALGRPELQSHVLSVRMVSLFVLTPLGFHTFGFSGALWGIVLSHFTYLPLIVWYNIRHELFDFRRELTSLLFLPAGMVLGMLSSAGVGYLWRI
ncbi:MULTISPECIES: oligosaccharide flippase family protein [unclassified Bradyrhizobium]